ncbi:MAG: 23S rRNA (adenine(2503)-C(2))-methyltransferase RlmN [Odoribacteraceae bacterium]|jgi:23S rRNA (adenine2503-C2)-methyltransferase|nr:23S rRNA (adenine(2503)-C(2))-methyltransferase RlmN [Odoribacteraceae bacterium]
MNKEDIRMTSPTGLTAFFEAHGEKAFRARQTRGWVWGKGVRQFEEMRDLPPRLRELLAEHFTLRTGEVTATLESRDGTVKLGVTLTDGEMVEMALIPAGGGRGTACVSTQVGCKLRCGFCATGGMGFTRDLNAGEIVDQVLLAREGMEARGMTPGNIVLMGMGEPLLNYDNVMEAVRLVTSPDALGISPYRVTLSTAGIPAGIRRLADDGARFHLAVSLHSATDAVRTRLMPVNRKFPLASVGDALAYFVEKTGTRPTLEYLLLRDVNDGEEDARALALFCRRFPVKINLIEYNPVAGSAYDRATGECRDRFIDFLERRNMVVNLRRSRGGDIDAACGQLANGSRG